MIYNLKIRITKRERKQTKIEKEDRGKVCIIRDKPITWA